jgi:TIR domain-containing protein
MLLFICHVSEDKDGFVAPLAAELRKKYDVWYDDYELTLGDSLPEKIDDGLKRCDFGIVVLSKAFFAKKKWGRKELDALIALEAKRGKIILPVLKGVTHEEFAEYSPLLGSRVAVAVSDSEGLPKVVEEIQLAVSVSDRKRELTTLDITKQRVEAFTRTMEERQRADQLLRSERGVQLVLGSIESIWKTIQTELPTDPDSPAPVKFRCNKPAAGTIYVSTKHGMHLSLHATNVCLNSVINTRLQAKIFQRFFEPGEKPSDPIMMYEADFKPAVRSNDEIVWIADDESYRTEELASHLIQSFLKHVEEEIDRHTE